MNLTRKIKNKITSELSTRLAGPVLSPFRKGGVVMFHIGRSGSTVLCDLLNQHPYVYWDREVYERKLPPWKQIVKDIPLKEISFDPVRYIQKRTKRSGRKYYGCEVKFFQLALVNLSQKDFIQATREFGFKHFIILERKNYLRAIVSSIILHQNNVIQVKAEKKSGIKKIHMDVNNVEIDRASKPLIRHLTEYTRDFNELKSLLAETGYLYLTYEDDIETSPITGYNKTCRFLEIQQHKPVIERGKMNPFPLSETIVNFQEVETCLKGTDFEWMLNA